MMNNGFHENGLGMGRIGVTSLPPMGCLLVAITLFGGGINDCVARLNKVVVAFNKNLTATKRHPGLKLFIFDIYNPLLDLIKNAANNGFFEAREASRGAGTVETSILYNTMSPDDLLLFCGSKTHSAEVIYHALKEFSCIYGLKPNVTKSMVFLAGSDPSYKSAIQIIFGFPIVEFSSRYLGISLIFTKLAFTDCKPLVDRITAMIRS